MAYDCIELEDVQDISVVRFKDEKVMDPSRIEKLGEELMSLAGEEDSCNLLINFEDVRFFSSAAINKLIVLEKRMRAGGGASWAVSAAALRVAALYCAICRWPACCEAVL